MKTEILKNDFLRRRLLSDSGEVWPFHEESKTHLEENTRTSTKSTAQSVDARRPRGRAARLGTGLLVALALMAAMLAAPAPSFARVSIGVSVSFGPPALPYYVQPPCPGPGYIWTPGYWAWDPAYGYYWVPGTWVEPPFVGALWTPGYWDYDDGSYVWYAGYWGPAVGYYGDIDYGYGYTGDGYRGGYWNDGRFYYNRRVNNISTVRIRNVYSRPVHEHFRDRHISYHGGPGGTNGRPTRTELAAARQRRSAAVSAQRRQMQLAKADPVERARVNHGRPRIAATRRPGAFNGHDAVPARSAGAPYHEPQQRRMRGNRMERPAHQGNARRHTNAAPNPQPARRTPERPQAREQRQPGNNPHQSPPVRRAPSRAQPRQQRPQQNHARHAQPQRHAQQAPQARERRAQPQTHARHAPPQRHVEHHAPRGNNGRHGPPKHEDGHGHSG